MENRQASTRACSSQGKEVQIRGAKKLARWAGRDHRSADPYADAVGGPQEATSDEHVADAGSLQHSYGACAARAYGVAVRLLDSDQVMAADIVVETFATVWQSGSGSGEGDRTDRERLLLWRIRERCIEVMHAHPGADSTVETLDLSPSSAILAMRERAVLSHVQRVSIERAFFQGRTSSQIADEMGIPKSLVHRAMRTGLQALAEGHSSTRAEATPASRPAKGRAAR